MHSEQKVVWTNGVFDLLHPGHVALLRFASTLGDKLVVGLDSDRRVAELKGSDRPVNNFEFRKSMLEAMRYVDQVVGFDSEEELRTAITLVAPTVIVESLEWADRQQALNPDFLVVPFGRIGGFSSSGIFNKIRSL